MTATTLNASVTTRRRRSPGVLPGFGLSMGFTVVYLSLLVLIPLAALPIKAAGLGWDGFLAAVGTPQALAAYRLTFGAALLAAFVNLVFGMIVAWVLVRYSFPGKRILDALVDLPFALPTAVAGIALSYLYSTKGWLGKPLYEFFGWKISYSAAGVVVALIFIGLPFVVRTVQPVLEDVEKELEEAAASLGASRWQTFLHVLFPAVLPALLTGFSLAFARAVGEYGSVVFIAGNRPMVSEIAPLLIVSRLERFDYAGAAAISTVLLVASFLLLLLINLLQSWQQRRGGVR
ncbi:sulfate ABC transporter permease subunit CysT [Kerstersia similis]|uniref:sulfate ABC transporter permease subunit CysT n=1 Tax=Kerstersia similis TaxID=206505 RepID=UPI0039F134B5